MKTHNVWIIGASTGIGASLAEELAQRGKSVALSARSHDTLEALRQKPAFAGVDKEHLVIPLDITNLDSLKAAKAEVLNHWSHIDSIVFMAGIYEPMQMNKLDLKEVRHILDVNLLGAFFVVEALLPVLRAQGYGQMAFCSSVAAYRGLPNSQPYGASKAGLTNMVESLKIEQPGLDIRLINPGFVESRLTDKNDFAMPMKISSTAAAIAIADGLESRHFEIHFPKRFTLFIKFLSLLPYLIYFWLIKKI